ncbi:MAG TPA: hypothetical protein VF092_05835 [Longimicrobium sp.]
MQTTRLWRQFEALSPAAQRQAASFIAFLSSRSKRRRTEDAEPPRSLRDEPFVGMWKDREDLVDSTEWVRRLRDEEWGV